ncbi:hypothetical protein PZ897_18325 [Hoeflea sp. YIM 152468]|uniref:hypothetical protein n=1 Tax=Hoeflea sp. YIM 152468 TaxID=3031759 RepID=UPI0023DA7DD1|nr:hypothetical protein [Hoeflea sp. YIM 152468]MDF1610143.1 hypothetical protein [Hoeflea sp. YIM 152468]
MNKLIIALGLTLATATGALAQTTALDAFVFPANDGTAALSTSGTSNDLVSYDRAGKDGSPTFAAPQGGIDFTATASTGGTVSNEQIRYDRAGNDGSPVFAR